MISSLSERGLLAPCCLHPQVPDRNSTPASKRGTASYHVLCARRGIHQWNTATEGCCPPRRGLTKMHMSRGYLSIFGTLEPTCKVHGYKVFLHVRSVFGWSQSEILILASNPDIRSACMYGQFSLDKTWTLQAGSSVLFNSNIVNETSL